MRCALLVVVMACSSKGTVSDSCDKRLERHARWVKTLVAEGTAVFPQPRDLRLVTLRGVAPAQLPLQPVIMLDKEFVTFQGKYLGSHDRLDPDQIARELAHLTEHRIEEITLAIDEGVPWRAVATVGRGAAMANLERLRFVFHGESTLAKPARSWIDAELEAVEKSADPDGPAPSLEPRPRMPGQRRLFALCPKAHDLFAELDARATKTGRDKGEVLADELPGALRSCGCAEDVDAVERWLWSLWNRYEKDVPHASISVELAPPGATLDIAEYEPWLLAHAKVVARAGQAVGF